MGIGEVVRGVAGALESQGVRVTPVPLTSHADELRAPRRRGAAGHP